MNDNIIRMHPKNETEEILRFALSRLDNAGLIAVSEKFGIDASAMKLRRRFRWAVMAASFAIGAATVAAYVVLHQ